MPTTGETPATAPDDSSWIAPVARDLSGKMLGDFAVERMLGRGGMGEVYLARQISLDRPVALKVLRPELVNNPVTTSRFEAEAWAAAKLSHPNIVHVYAIGTNDKIRFIAMEYVQGTNLKDYLAKKGIPDLPLALAIMRQSGQAVAAAGEVGLVHRDIKPENLLLTRKGQVKVADFGLCRLPDEERNHITQTGMTLGTPLYMSPEQVQGKEIDHRSDLYSLGVTFFQMLTGTPPFQADTALALALKHVREQPPSLAVARPDLPPEMVALVRKLMEKKTKDRYQSAAEMLKDLARVKEVLQSQMQVSQTLAEPLAITAASTVAHPTLRNSAEKSTAASDKDSPVLPWRPSGRILLGAGLVGLLLGGTLGWLARSKDHLSPSADNPQLPPALWMAPWENVPQQPSSIAQYRYALTRAPTSELDSAWLAVPGRYPSSGEDSFAAYLQLARFYLRRDDQERLHDLSEEIKAFEQRNGQHRERWLFLAKLIHASESAVKGDAEEVAYVIDNAQSLATISPPLAELALEAVMRTIHSIESKGGNSTSLTNLRNKLLTALKLPSGLIDRSTL